MKSTLLLLIIPGLASAQFFDRLLGKTEKNVISTNIQWSCPSARYNSSSVQEFPQSERVSVEFHYKENGELKFKLSPDIFGRKLLDTSRITRLFGEDKPVMVTDAGECLQKFKNDFNSWVTQNQSKLCDWEKKACDNQQSIISSFELDLNQKEFVRNSGNIKVMPRYFAGHTFYSASQDHYRQAYKNFCDGDRSRPVVYTSKGFLQYVKNVAANPLASLNEECLNKLDKFNKDNQLKTGCEPKEGFCAHIDFDAEVYTKNLSNLKDGRIETLAQEEKLTQNFSAYREAPSSLIAKIGQHIATKTEFEGWLGCWLPHSFQGEDGKTDYLYYYDNAIAAAMPYIKENFDKDCKKHILKNYLSNKYINDDPLESSFCRRNPCEHIKRSKELFEENVQALLADIYGTEVAQNACFSDKRFREKNLEVESFLGELQEISSCSDLKEGETKVVSGNVTGVGANYAIERLDGKNLKAKVAIDFSDGKKNTSVTSAQMLERAKNCIEVASTYFKSPDGETINVEIISGEESKSIPASQRPPLNKVSIEPVGHRSNSRAYVETISCEVITHEVLHLMGLCDEYEEKSSKFYINTETGKPVTVADDLESLKKAGKVRTEARYQCRALATVDSVMSNQSDVFNRAAGAKATCECDTELCRGVMDSGDKNLQDILITDVWRGIQNRRNVCSYKRGKTKKAHSPEDFSGMPMYEIVKDSGDEFAFKHTELQVGFDNGAQTVYAVEYTYTCGGCRGEEQCQSVQTIKDRVRNKTPMYSRFCPVGTKKVEQGYAKSEDAKTPNLTVAGNGVFSMTTPPQEPGMSMLHPAHFARIKFGTCANKVKNYSTCAKYAYKDRNPEDCSDRPALCEDVNQWLLSDQ